MYLINKFTEDYLNMNKSDLVDAVASSADMSKAQASNAVDAVSFTRVSWLG